MNLNVSADAGWIGRILLDCPRHRTNVRLPLNYPRLNEFPEWFTVVASENYDVSVASDEPRRMTGAELLPGDSGRKAAEQCAVAASPAGRDRMEADPG